MRTLLGELKERFTPYARRDKRASTGRRGECYRKRRKGSDHRPGDERDER